MNTLTYQWTYGTAYDLFLSLHVLHEPEIFGLRPSWAAGVRSRLTLEEREILEAAQSVIWLPAGWIGSLPEPRDGATAIWMLGRLSAAERLPALTLESGVPTGAREILMAVASHGTWAPGDLENLREAFQTKKNPPRPKALETMLHWWARSAEFGQRYLAALQSYQDVFFAEEEKRILPALTEALAWAQDLAGELAFEDLVEELSRGIRLELALEATELVLVPSYWVSPLIVLERQTEGRSLFLFGARPPDVSLVPGEQVPERMLRALKTLADPTRLRILRYLTREKITPAEVARRLRLRAPTVTHHLNLLRLAGLVTMTLNEAGERRYETRLDAVAVSYADLQNFLGGDLSLDFEENADA